MSFLTTLSGGVLAGVYAYLKYNVEGYWYAIPFFILIIILESLE